MLDLLLLFSILLENWEEFSWILGQFVTCLQVAEMMFSYTWDFVGTYLPFLLDWNIRLENSDKHCIWRCFMWHIPALFSNLILKVIPMSFAKACWSSKLWRAFLNCSFTLPLWASAGAWAVWWHPARWNPVLCRWLCDGGWSWVMLEVLWVWCWLCHPSDMSWWQQIWSTVRMVYLPSGCRLWRQTMQWWCSLSPWRKKNDHQRAWLHTWRPHHWLQIVWGWILPRWIQLQKVLALHQGRVHKVAMILRQQC